MWLNLSLQGGEKEVDFLKINIYKNKISFMET